MNNEIRYKRLKCTDPKRIHLFLHKARVAHFALADKDYPYILPMAFVWHNFKIYCHGSSEGRKNELIGDSANSALSISEDYGYTIAPVPANASTAYMNIMMNGKISLLKNLDESRLVLDKMLSKYLPSYYQKDLSKDLVEKYKSSMGAKTAVFVFEPVDLTAKFHDGTIDDLYFDGRTRSFDANMEKDIEALKSTGLIKG